MTKIFAGATQHRLEPGLNLKAHFTIRSLPCLLSSVSSLNDIYLEMVDDDCFDLDDTFLTIFYKKKLFKYEIKAAILLFHNCTLL